MLENHAKVLKTNEVRVSTLEEKTKCDHAKSATKIKCESLLNLMDALENLDDLQSVTANFEMAQELMSLTMV